MTMKSNLNTYEKSISFVKFVMGMALEIFFISKFYKYIKYINTFSRTHRELSQHYKKNHFPCLDTECITLGIVFRTDVELNVHKVYFKIEFGNNKLNIFILIF